MKVGAFIWNLGDILGQGQQPKDYAKAIVDGLEAETAKPVAAGQK